MMDLFTTSHNHDLQKYMILDQTTLGGVFSIIFFILALLLIGTAIINYQLLNIKETKALVPLVTLENEITDYVASNIAINISFVNYGDSCGKNNICVNGIAVT